MRSRFAAPYRPLYFLSALGMGGLAVSFFMYLMFLIPHPASPIPTFSDLAAVFAGDDVVLKAIAVPALAGIAYFAVRHVQLLVRAIAAHREFTRTPDYVAFRQSNAEVSLMAIPLTLGMTVNVLLIVAAVFVPGLWSVKEFLFPGALLAMTAIGAYAFAIFGRYAARILTHQNFDLDDNNHFSQVLPSFAFTMIATGFSSSAAMSSNTVSVVIGLLGSFTFLVAAGIWVFIKLPVSFSAMLRHGAAPVAGPTLWLGVPIFTLVGITVIRDTMGIAHNLAHVQVPAVIWFVFFGLLVIGQALMLAMGYAVMRRLDYFGRYVHGPEASPASYGLICPGVAFSVLSMFFIHWGLVAPGIVAKFSPVHIVLLAGVLVTQTLTIRTVALLNRKHLRVTPEQPAPVDEQEPAYV